MNYGEGDIHTKCVAVRKFRCGRIRLWLRRSDNGPSAANNPKRAQLLSRGYLRDSTPSAMVLAEFGPLFGAIGLVELCQRDYCTRKLLKDHQQYSVCLCDCQHLQECEQC